MDDYTGHPTNDNIYEIFINNLRNPFYAKLKTI